MPAADRIARARACIGVPFRLHGRDPQTGMDCVGLVAHAAGAGRAAPLGYSLRTTRIGEWIAILSRQAQLRDAEPQPGDVLLLDAGPAQLHLGIWTGESLIHAHAGLRRIVETPAPLPWPILSVWHPVGE